MKRWLNEEIQATFLSRKDVGLLNPCLGSGYKSLNEKAKREAFRPSRSRRKIKGIVDAVRAKCG